MASVSFLCLFCKIMNIYAKIRLKSLYPLLLREHILSLLKNLNLKKSKFSKSNFKSHAKMQKKNIQRKKINLERGANVNYNLSVYDAAATTTFLLLL